MSRKPFDPNRDHSIAEEPTSAADRMALMPCRVCNAPTAWETLAMFGARCSGCYRAYCAAPKSAPAVMPDKRRYGGRAWAQALRAREQAGDDLTQFQRDAWRTVLLPRGEATDGSEA